MNAVAELLPAFPPGHTSIYLKCYYMVRSFNSTTKGIEQKREIKNNIKETNIGILATVEQGKGEVLVIEIPENYQTKKIMELKLPVKAIVGVIQRRKRIIIPNGATQIMGGDNLIIFTTSENAPNIKEFFEEIE